jgi:hypothetical protein
MSLDFIFALLLVAVGLAVARAAYLAFHQRAYDDPKRKIVTAFEVTFFGRPKTNAPAPVGCVGGVADKP